MSIEEKEEKPFATFDEKDALLLATAHWLSLFGFLGCTGYFEVVSNVLLEQKSFLKWRMWTWLDIDLLSCENTLCIRTQKQYLMGAFRLRRKKKNFLVRKLRNVY